jgi:predicted porin
MTIVLGDAAHLSSQNMSSNGAAAGAVSFDSADDDASVGAFVGGFQGVSLGYKISDAMSATVAYQKSSDYSDMLGAGENFDGEGATYGTTGTGLGFSGTFGPATVGLTIASAATADVGSPTVNPASNSTAASTTGLGVKLDLGDIKPFLSYGSYKADGSVSLNGVSYSGNEIGTKYMLGTDSIVFYIGSYEEITTTAGTAGNALTKSGMELGYNTTVGPASLAIGYGSQTHAQTDGATDGYSMTDIEVAMGFSF